ncbi:DUF3857 and transglutaminase domain-containing protein [Flavobacteriaceae bacterium TK19130]|nr:DUF3857 and transglutaminase domain-containing protein [Thermobacterium salinum]
MIKKITLLCILISTLSFSQDYRFGKISEEELLETEHPKYPEADAAILYREIKSHFEFNEKLDFHIVTEVFERIKIYNKEGYDWATHVIELYQGSGAMDDDISGLKGYTYYLNNSKIKDFKLRKDGIFEEEITEFLERVTFTMPNVADGSVIEFKYTIRSPYIGDIEPLRLQENIPVNRVEVQFRTPEYFNYKMHQRGWLPFRVNESQQQRTMNYSYETSAKNGTGGFGSSALTERKKTTISFNEKEYSVALSDVPPVKKEAYSGNIDNYSAALQFELSYLKYPNSPLKMVSTTWEDVCQTIYKSGNFGGQLDKDGYFKNDLDDLLENTENDNERIVTIFEYVKSRMNWNGIVGVYSQRGVRKAYDENKGSAADINLMLIAMLRYAGIAANPILVSTKSHGIPIFPTRNGFNFVIAGVEIEDAVLMLDATHEESIPNVLKNELLNWQGRLIREDGSSTWINLIPKIPASQSSIVSYGIDMEDLSTKGSVNNRWKGHLAMKNRRKYSNVSESEIAKSLEGTYSNVDIETLDSEGLQDVYSPLNIRFDFNSVQGIEEIAGKLYITPMLFLGESQNPFKLDDRKYPIDFNYPFQKRFIISMNIPEGYIVETVPESVNFVLGQDKGSFQYRVQVNNNVVQCFVDMGINQALLSSTIYPELKKFFELILEKENEKVVLTKA